MSPKKKAEIISWAIYTRSLTFQLIYEIDCLIPYRLTKEIESERLSNLPKNTQ